MVEFDVVDLGDPDHVEEGDRAPDFTRPLVTAEYWENVALSDLLEDGPVALVCHPMDGAFPATYVWNEIRDREWADEGDLSVVGLSVSSPYEHKTLIEERGLGEDYRLYSDPGNDVAREYGVAHDLDGMAGVSEPRPAVFLVDEDRTVTYAWVATEWPAFPDYDEIEGAIAELV